MTLRTMWDDHVKDLTNAVSRTKRVRELEDRLMPETEQKMLLCEYNIGYLKQLVNEYVGYVREYKELIK